MVAREISNKENDDEIFALQIANELIDATHPMNIESLLDTITAIYHDCNFPALKRLQSVEIFLSKFGSSVKTLIDSRMKVSDFRMIKVIGRGACGEVQVVRHTRTQKVFAMKRLEKIEMIRRYDFSFFWEERDIMAHSNSDWIVKMFYSFQDQRYLYMVMEFMPGGDLFNLMAREEISEEWARFYIAELVLAIDTVHSLNYLHRDIKPDNILISSTGHVKLADFGTCVKLNSDGKIKSAIATGSPDYISPEVLNSQCSKSVYGAEVDYWSVGVILYEMLFGNPTFHADTLPKTYSRIQNFETELKFPPDIDVSNEAKDIIKKFLSAANVRLGCNGSAEVRKHPFFKNDSWTFENICQATPPFIPTLITDDDTSNFDDVDPSDNSSAENFQTQQTFTGSQLPFIGFTYSNEFNPALTLARKDSQIDQSLIEAPETLSIVENNEKITVDKNMQAGDKKEKMKKSRLENGIHKLQNNKVSMEACFNTLREEYSTAQSLIDVYKAESGELRNKYYEHDRKLNHFDDALKSLSGEAVATRAVKIVSQSCKL